MLIHRVIDHLDEALTYRKLAVNPIYESGSN